MNEATAVLLTLIVYKLVLIGIGVWAARRVQTEDDFFTGGRAVGGIVSGFSYAASTSSAWVLLGYSGFVFASGLQAVWLLPGIMGGYGVMWLIIGRPLRAAAAERRHVTLTDYLIDGLGAGGRRLVAILSTVLILGCFVFYIAAQFDAAAKAFMDQFGLSLTESVLIGAVIIVVYSLLGGFWAVSVTDTLQGMVMAVVSVGLPIVALFAVGGPLALVESLNTSAPPGYLDVNGGMAGLVLVGFAAGLVGTGLGAFGQPHLLARLMAVKDDAARRRGFWITLCWGLAVYSGMTLLALSARVLLGGDIGDGEVMFYRVASAVLPPVLAGIVIAAILSAVMSTVDSILLSAAGAVAHDLGLNRAYPRHALLISRLVMVGIAGLAVSLALSLPDTIFNRVLFAWSALGAAFGPLLFARITGRRPGAILSSGVILLGFSTTVLFYGYGTVPDGGILGQLARLPGDPFERAVPWLVPVVLLFGLSPQQPRSGDASNSGHKASG